MSKFVNGLYAFFCAIVEFFSDIWFKFRGTFGLYSFTAEESASFNPTIIPYYRRLRADYKRLCPPDNHSPCWDQRYLELKTLIDDLDQDDKKATRSDLYVIESFIAALSSDDYLVQAYPGLQDRYRELVGADAYQRYEKKLDPELTASPLKPSVRLREDSLFLIAELRRLAIAIPRRETLRTWLLWQVVLVSMTIAAALFWILIGIRWQHFPYLLLVALFSLLGGIVSVSRRLQSTPDSELNLAQWGRGSLMLSPILAMGFGIVLYYVMAAGLIKGATFPDFTTISVPTTCIALRQSDAQTGPNAKAPSQIAKDEAKCDAKSDSQAQPAPAKRLIDWFDDLNYAEFSKLLIWAFIAGFAEQLVPDTLDSLISKQKQDSSKSK